MFAHDHFGHGESGPYEKTDRNRCQLRSFDESADDIIARIEIVKEKYPEKKVILCGHSMGGLLSCLVAEKYKGKQIFLLSILLCENDFIVQYCRSKLQFQLLPLFSQFSSSHSSMLNSI